VETGFHSLASRFPQHGFPLYGGAVINTYMLKEIPMTRSSFGLGFTLLNLFVGIPSILVGASIVRWGIRKTFGIGSALILAGALWLSLIASGPGTIGLDSACSRQWESVSGPSFLPPQLLLAGSAAIEEERWPSPYPRRICRFFVVPMINGILTANGGNWRQHGR